MRRPWRDYNSSKARIKKLDDKFLDALDEAEICNWHSYLKERRKIVEERIMEK